MNCPRCGTALMPGDRACPTCGDRVFGNDIIHAVTTVTWQKAWKGGMHTVDMWHLQNPLYIRLKPRTRSGDKVRVAGGRLMQADGSILIAPVEVTVHVEPTPLWVKIVTVVLCLALLAGVGYGIWTAVEYLETPEITITLPTEPRPTTRPTEPAEWENPDPTEKETIENEPTEYDPTEYDPTEYDPTERPSWDAGSSIMNYELRPMLQQLSEDHLTNLEAIYWALMDFEASVELPRDITVEEMDYLLQILHYECPELMQYDYFSGGMYYYDTTTNLVSSYDLPYTMTQAEYQDMYDACEAVINGLVDQTQGMTDWEKEQLVFDYITTNCAYDMDIEHAGSAYGTLVQEIAKCDGISFATKWLLEEMGISCIVVNGDPVEGEIGHAWNYVLLDGAYYGLDVTADVRRPGDECPVLFCAYNVSTDVVDQTYILCPVYSEYVQTPTVTTMDQSYHVRNGSYMTAGSDWRGYVQMEFLAACQNGGEFRFQFESTADYEACRDALDQLCNDTWNTSGLSGTVSWIYWYIDEFNTVYIGVTRG